MRLLAPFLLASAAASMLFAADGRADLITVNPNLVSARDARIAYMGRVAFDQEGAHMGFPGITIRFVYRGPAPIIRMRASSPDCYFNLSCNGWKPVIIRLKKGENEFSLSTGRAPEQGWLVELVRRTEAWQGLVTFQGLQLPAGCALLPPPPWPTRKLMFVGDSITCGEYLERFPPELDNSPRTTDAARSFGMLLGKWLHAQVQLVSYGGRGVMRDWQGRTDTNNAPQFFGRTMPDDPNSHWDPANYVPDAIVVCLGTNDFNVGLPKEAVFTKAYEDFVRQIRADYPHAALLLAESPMFGDTPGTEDRAKRDLLRRVLDAVVAEQRAAGDHHIAVAPVSHFPGTPSNAHPLAFGHEQIALELLGPIRALTGW